MTPIIETHELTKRFGGRTAVDRVSLSVPAGCAFGFLGHNGAGKTTTIRMLLGLTGADGGTMSLRGLPVPARRGEALARVGAIVEEPSFHAHDDRPREPARARGGARPGGVRADRRRAGARRPCRSCRRARLALLPGNAPAPRRRALPARRPGAADPRRADERPGPGRDPRVPPDDPRAGRRRPNGVPLLAPARRGREGLRRRGDHRRGADRHQRRDRGDRAQQRRRADRRLRRPRSRARAPRRHARRARRAREPTRACASRCARRERARTSTACSSRPASRCRGSTRSTARSRSASSRSPHVWRASHDARGSSSIWSAPSC